MSKTLTNELKVGLLLVFTLFLSLFFAWIIGIHNPFQSSLKIFVTYHFAGGIDVGSPVRVSGIKVGKVEKIEFFQTITPTALLSLKEPGSDVFNEKTWITPLKIQISIRKDATSGIRQDSRFYINLAGIIGERYIEATPGSYDKPALQTGDVVAGVDPPRIDQLISQSFDLMGKIKDLILSQKGDWIESLRLINTLSAQINKTLVWVDKSALFKSDFSPLITNLIHLSTHLNHLTEEIQSPEGKKIRDLVGDLLWRLKDVDKKSIEKFFQKEGVKVQLF